MSTDADPLDVAVQVDEIERYKFALALAARHGYADNPDAFASRLRGSTTTELEADATGFADEIAEIRSRQDPPRVMAVDPSQAMGRDSKSTPSQRDQFADILYNAITR